MTRIFLIRHAEAEGNLYRIAQGQFDSNLTGRGWRQVRALEGRFAGVHVDAVYSSDLYRTCATASALYRPKKLPLVRRSDLREICVGDWEQRTWGDIFRLWPAEMEDFSLHMDRWSIPGAETPAQVLARVRAAVEDIARENPGKTVAVFCHGYAIRLLLANLQGISLADTGSKTPTGDNTAVSVLEFDGDRLRVVSQNDNTHLLTPEFLAGEKVRKRANALEPGLWFAPLDPAAHGALLTACAGECGVSAEALSAPAGLALAGYLRDEPVGLLRMDGGPGRIAWAYIRPDCRKRGFGVQLVGQAVQHARNEGVDTLSAVLPAGSAARDFLLDCGFSSEDGSLYVKHIGFDPEILGEK